MKIGDLFKRLSYGELTNLSMANGGDGTIREADRPKLVNHVNEALLRLHSRFILRENMLFIEQVGNMTTYPLEAQYAAQSGSSETHKFIKDTVSAPFKDDVIKVLKISDESGFTFPLNDDEDPNSLFTPQPNILQIPLPQAEVVLAVIYQARHPVLDVSKTGTDLTNQEFKIPFTLESALQKYVAHLVYSHMNGQENILKGQEFLAGYEQICAEISAMDLVNQSVSTTNTRFELRGWI